MILRFDHADKQYMHKPESVPENAMHQILLDFEIQTNHGLWNNHNNNNNNKTHITWRKGNLQVLENIRSRHHQIRSDETKNNATSEIIRRRNRRRRRLLGEKETYKYLEILEADTIK